jgi:RNA polymerase sigma-70 factor (ECF subfamily)
VNPDERDDRAADAARLAAFDQHRGLLFSIAYRMLGSVADAEDMLQETFIRWQRASGEEIRSPRSFLVTIVSRLCINQLQSARAQRETYVGQWLPEPLITDAQDDPFGIVRTDESLSMALLVLLERLTPLERAVLLLHDVFGYSHGEIAKTLEQTEANCRQSLHRAHLHVGDVRRRFDANAQEHRELLERFLDAAREGQLERLIAMLTKDAVMHIDGGAKAAVPNVIRGSDKVARGLTAGARALPAGMVMRAASINGQAGIVTYIDGKPYSVLVLDIRDGRVHGVYIVARPEKLAHLPDLEDAP